MDSKNIFIKTTEKVVELSGGIIGLAFISKEQRAKNFKRALFDYTCEKLLETDENQVIVEEIGLVFKKLDSQFTSQEEKNEFYKNYVHCILSQYATLTEIPYVWKQKNTSEEGPYPRIENDTLLTTPDTTPEETAIWLFRQFDKELQKSSGNYQKRKK